jgi:hypothetical protein
MKRLITGTISLVESAIDCPLARLSTSAYAIRSRCTGGGNSRHSRDGLGTAAYLHIDWRYQDLALIEPDIDECVGD